MFGKIARLAKSAVKVAGKVGGVVSKVPGLRTVSMAIPGLGIGLAAIEGAKFASGMLRSQGGGGGAAGLPALPALPAPGGMMTTTSGGGIMEAATVQQAVTGKRGTGSMPPLTMEMIQQLQAAGLMIGFKDLRVTHRSPIKGFVVVHPRDPQSGQVATFALRKDIARKWGLWSAQTKPPITGGDINAIRKANSVVKKLRKLNSEVKSVANFGQTARRQPLRVVEIPGRKLIARKAA